MEIVVVKVFLYKIIFCYLCLATGDKIKTVYQVFSTIHNFFYLFQSFYNFYKL